MIIKRRRRTTEEDRAKELAKAREKRQKKMIRTKYGQAPKANMTIGFIGLGTLALSFMGLLLGVRGFRERDKNYITCKIGAICCGLLVLGMCAIFIRGLF